MVKNVLKKKWQDLGKASRSVLTLVTGTVIAQTITIAASPVLSRLYSPEEFGYFAVIASIVGVLAIAASGRYEQAIMLPENDQDAWEITLVALSLTIFFSIFVSLIVYVIYTFQVLSGIPRNLLSVVPVGVFLYAMIQIFICFANRNRKYKHMSQNRIAQAAISVSSQVSLVLLKPDVGALGLLGGMLAGYIFSTIFLACKINIFDNVSTYKLSLSWASLQKQALRYRDFFCFSMPNAVANSASRQVPNILLASMFGPMVTGHYSLGYRLVSAPLALLGNC